VVAKIIDFCARRRALIVVALGLALGASLVAIRRVKLDAIPDLSEPQVVVSSGWMGRSPTLVEDQVTYPIASKLIGIPHVTDVRGVSMLGMSFIYVIFEDGTDLSWARDRVTESVNGLRGALPEDVTPTLGADATGIGWVFQYTLTDRTSKHDLDALRAFQEFTLRYALENVPGVAEVASVGGYQRQYQVTVDPNRLRAYRITLAEVIDAIRRSGNDVGGRVVDLSGHEYYLRGRGYIRDPGALEAIAVRPGGVDRPALLIRDLATVSFAPEARRGLLDWNGAGEAVGGVVIVRNGANALDVITRVKSRLEELQSSFPPGVELKVAYDRTALIGRATSTLTHVLAEEIVVVSLVIVLFLLHLRSALLAILLLPLGVGLAFVPMVLLDIPSTIMSLGGLAIAIGACVDAYIVMIEAGHKKLEQAGPGADRQALLARAAKEIAPALFFSLLIVAVAFLPIFALNGQAGHLFKPLAYTKTFVMLISALLSITALPALQGFFVRGRIAPERANPLSRFIIVLYEPFVHVALRRPLSTVAIGTLALVSAVPMALRLGSEFMPPLNEGDILYMPTAPPGLSLEEAKRQVQKMDRVLVGFPEVASVFGKVGRADSTTDPAPINMIEATVRLRPRAEWRSKHQDRWYSGRVPGSLTPMLRLLWPDERPLTWDELTSEMDARLQATGWTNAWTMPIKARVDMLTTGVRTAVGIKVFGTSVGEIEKTGLALEHLLAPIKGGRSVFYERALGGLYLDIVPKPQELARYGLTTGDLERVIESASGSSQVDASFDGRRRIATAVQFRQDRRDDWQWLREVSVPLSTPDPTQTSVSLGQVADVQVASGPSMVRNEAGLLVGYVYVDVDEAERDIGGYVEEAKAKVSSALAGQELTLAPGTFLKWTGQYEQLEAMRARLKVIVPLTLVLIVGLLFVQFRNVVEVGIVLLSIPFALVGSFWLLWLLDYRLSTAVWVGVIALMGLAAQTGIVMIVYIDQAYTRWQAEGRIRSLDDIIAAHMEGTVQRVRPKVMTVAAMAIGLAPLLWATGSGADVMKRIAAPMLGGLLTSAFLTLEIIPVVVTYWRYEQLVWRQLGAADAARWSRLRACAHGVGLGAMLAVGLLVAALYLRLPRHLLALGEGGAGLLLLCGLGGYLFHRRVPVGSGAVVPECDRAAAG